MRFALLSSPFVFSAWADARDQVTSSVVKIHVTRREPDFVRPWNKGNPEEIAGSGVIIDGKRILTNAHVVLYASQIFVQADQSTERVPAKVKAIAPGIDLAIVEVEKPSFFDGRPPLPLADDIPAVKQTVNVYGYPIGGEQISVTQGIVSRIECTAIYYFVRGLRIQIDAALNPGNSGGPAVADGKIVGPGLQQVHQGREHRLPDRRRRNPHVPQGHPRRHATTENRSFGTICKSTENEALRAKLGLEKETGVVVCLPFSSAPDYPLKKWDVITRIGGEPLDNQGNVKIKDDLRLSFQYLVPKLAKDGRVQLTIFRDRKPLDVQVPVRPDGNFVMPFLMGKYPRYFIYGPMVFMPASQELMTRWLAGSWASMLMMQRRARCWRGRWTTRRLTGEEIVTLGYGLLPHKTSKGYTPVAVQRRDPRQRHGRAQHGAIWWSCSATPRASS